MEACEEKKVDYKEGDVIDALKIDILHKKICWSQARIVEIIDNLAKVRFLYDNPSTSRYFYQKNSFFIFFSKKTFFTFFSKKRFFSKKPFFSKKTFFLKKPFFFLH